MTFQPEVNTPINIDGVVYRIAEHPVAPGVPYGQEGRAAVVYQLIAGEDTRALKVFKPRFRLPTLVTLADRLAHYGDLPGLDVCRRTVLTARRHTALLQEHPDLIYAVVMPWIEGPTWMEVLLDERELAPEQSLHFAHSFADVLSNMQEEGIAHCDLSGPNLILPALAIKQPKTTRALFPLQLVDVEQMFGPELDRPRAIPTGSQGYAHKTAPEGLWEPNADRFAGAVMLCEMLGWCDERVRKANWGENYFDPDEMQQAGQRYDVMVTVLRERWGSALAELFERAWHSETLDDCPTFGEWFVSLPDNLQVQTPGATPAPGAAASTQVAAPSPTEIAALGLSQAAYQTIKDLMSQAQTYTDQGYLGSAIALLREAQSLAPERSRLELDLSSQIDDLELRVMQGEEARIAPDIDRDRKPAVAWTSFAPEKTGPSHPETRETVPGSAALTTAPAVQTDGRANGSGGAVTVAQPLAGVQGTAYGQTTAASTGTAVVAKPARSMSFALIGVGLALLLVVALAVLALPQGAPLHAAIFGSPVAQVEPTASPTAPVVALNDTPTLAESTATVAVVATEIPTEPPTATTAAQEQATATPQAGGGTSTGLSLRINSIAFSPDGKYLATGTSNNIANIFSVADQKIVFTLTQHTGWVTGVAFSHDGSRLATVSTDQTLIVWNTADGKPIKTFSDVKDRLTGVAFSPTDNNQVAASSNDGSVRVWDIDKGVQLSTFQGPTKSALCLAYSPDGTMLATGSADDKIYIRHIPDGQFIRTLDGAQGPILSIAFSPDSKKIAAGSEDKIAYIWKVDGNNPPETLQGHEGPVNSVRFSIDGGLLASASDDGYVKIWSVSDRTLQQAQNDNVGAITSLALSPDGKTLVAGNAQGTLRLYGP